MKKFLIAIFFLSLFSCSREKSSIIRINEKFPDGIFQLTKTTLEIPTVNFEHAITYDEFGYPLVNFQKFDRLNPGKITKIFDAVILENKYFILTLLPNKGKPYSFIYKVTGHEELFIPSVEKRVE